MVLIPKAAGYNHGMGRALMEPTKAEVRLEAEHVLPANTPERIKWGTKMRYYFGKNEI